MNTDQIALKRSSIIRWTSIAVLLVSIAGILISAGEISTGGGMPVIIGTVVAGSAMLISMGGLVYANVKFANLLHSVR